MTDYLQSIDVACPYCGETYSVALDTPEAGMRFIEDCPICCQPIEFSVSLAGDRFTLMARRDDE